MRRVAERDWDPELLHTYGLRPWEMHLFTTKQLDEIGNHHKAMREAERA